LGNDIAVYDRGRLDHRRHGRPEKLGILRQIERAGAVRRARRRLLRVLGLLRILRDSRRCRRERQRSRSGQCTRKSHSKLFRHVRSNPLKIPPDVAVAV